MSTVRTGAEHEMTAGGVGRTPGSPAGGTDAPEGGPVSVSVRYWAGARAAAGVESEAAEAATVADLATVLAKRHPALEPVFAVATVLVDGLAAEPTTPLRSGMTVEVLPPFAGG